MLAEVCLAVALLSSQPQPMPERPLPESARDFGEQVALLVRRGEVLAELELSLDRVN